MPNARTLHAKQARTVQVNELFAGTILDTATDLDTEVRATGTISATGFTYGPCAWQPTLTADPGVVRIPQAGDPCLIGVDDEGNSWIVQWYGGVDFSIIESWRAVGAVGQPAFQNSWVNYGGVYQPLRFMKDPFGFVHLEGCIKNGTNAASVFTLPTGYRPPNKMIFRTHCWNSVGIDANIVANADGTVQASTSDSSNGEVWMNLSFRSV